MNKTIVYTQLCEPNLSQEKIKEMRVNLDEVYKGTNTTVVVTNFPVKVTEIDISKEPKWKFDFHSFVIGCFAIQLALALISIANHYLGAK